MTGMPAAALQEVGEAANRPGRFSSGLSWRGGNATANEAFSAVFESSGEALVVTDTSGTIHRANTRARQVLGLRETIARGLGLGTVLAEQSGNRVLVLCDTANPARRSSVDAALVTGHPIRITLRAVLPHSRDLLLCIEEGSVVRRAETQWRQVEGELRSVLDSVQAGVIVFDRAGHVRFTNARFAQLFGLDVRAFTSMKTIEDVHATLAPRFRDPKAFSAPWHGFARGEGEPVHDEMEILRPAKRVIERFSRPVLDGQGRAVGWLEIYTDVTGERQIQTKILQTEKMAAVGHLVSGIAHELNNPLTAIMGYAQLLLGQALKGNQREQAKNVYQEAERARRIVKNLLYFGRENQPQRSRVDFNEVIERALALRSYELKVENIRVTCDLANDLPYTMADPYQLQQVILNLLINAEQALVEGRGQGRVSIRTRRVSRSEVLPPGKGPEERIAIEIADDGPGIPPEIADRIFDPFFTTKPPGLDGPGFHDSLERTNSPMRKKLLFITGDVLGRNTLEFLAARKLPYLAKPFLVEELKLTVHELLRSGGRSAASARRAKA